MFRKRNEVLWLSLVLATIAILGIGLVVARTKVRGLTGNSGGRPAQHERTDQVSNPKERIEGELITVYPHGIEPAEITRGHRQFALILDNRSGLPEVDLRLDREQGSRVREVRVPHEQRNWSEILDLAPGQYVLSEANHPSWTCRITITPNN